MELDLLLIVALSIALVVLVVLSLRLFRPFAVTLAVGPGRQIIVGGTPFPASGPAVGHENFAVPRSAVTEADDDVIVSLRTAVEATDQAVSISRRRLQTLHIDAGLESDIIVYGGYGQRRTLMWSSAVAEEEPKCIWCLGGIIVCGINPKCR